MWPSRALTLLEMKISCQTTFLNHRPPSPTSGRDPRRAEPPEGECATPAQQRLTFPQATMERATWYQRWNSPKANFMARSRHCGEGDSQYFPARVLSPPGHPDPSTAQVTARRRVQEARTRVLSENSRANLSLPQASYMTLRKYLTLSSPRFPPP